MLPQRLLRTTTLLSSLRFHQIGLWISLSLSLHRHLDIVAHFHVFFCPRLAPKLKGPFPCSESPFSLPSEKFAQSLFCGATWQSWSSKKNPLQGWSPSRVSKLTLSPIIMEVENYPKWRKLIFEGPIFHFQDCGGKSMSCLAVFHQGSLREKLLQSICLIWSKVNLCTLSCLPSPCG